MFAKYHVSVPTLALAAAFALPLAAQAGETPDPDVAIRAQILGVWKGQPVTGAAIVDVGAIDTQERARRALLGLPSPEVAVPLVGAAAEPMDIREQARRQILDQPTAERAAPAGVAVIR